MTISTSSDIPNPGGQSRATAQVSIDRRVRGKDGSLIGTRRVGFWRGHDVHPSDFAGEYAVQWQYLNDLLLELRDEEGEDLDRDTISVINDLMTDLHIVRLTHHGKDIFRDAKRIHIQSNDAPCQVHGAIPTNKQCHCTDDTCVKGYRKTLVVGKFKGGATRKWLHATENCDGTGDDCKPYRITLRLI